MSHVEAQGKRTWRQVAAVIDGKNVPVGSGVLLTLEGGGYTVTVNGRVYQRGTAEVDYAKDPHESDVHVTHGTGAGTTVRQIFKVQGDVLIACNAAPGEGRPTEFTSPPGSGQALSVWLRADAAAASPAQNWRMWVVIGLVLGAFNFTADLQKDLAEQLGRGTAVALSIIATAAAVTLICIVLRWGWRAGVVLGVTMAVAINTFGELRRAIEPNLGDLGAILVGGCTGLVVALVISAVLSRLLGWRW